MPLCDRSGLAVFCAAVTIGLRADEPKIETPSYNTMTDTQEIAIGREAAAEIEKERKLTFVEVPRVQAYVSRVVAQLAGQSRRPQLAYSVKVVDTAQINAFALPGGFLYVNRGLIEWARSESEVAAVLGHEVGHVVGRHCCQQHWPADHGGFAALRSEPRAARRRCPRQALEAGRAARSPSWR